MCDRPGLMGSGQAVHRHNAVARDDREFTLHRCHHLIMILRHSVGQLGNGNGDPAAAMANQLCAFAFLQLALSNRS